MDHHLSLAVASRGQSTIDPLSELYLATCDDQRTLRWSLAGAILVHAIALLIHFPSQARNIVVESPKARVHVLETLRFKEPGAPSAEDDSQTEGNQGSHSRSDTRRPRADSLHQPQRGSPGARHRRYRARHTRGSAAPVPETAIYVQGAVAPPVRTLFVEPRYTEMARRARIQGLVVLQTVIDHNGDVKDVRALKSLPLGLTEAAIDAVSRWKYEPATLQGRPVCCVLQSDGEVRPAIDWGKLRARANSAIVVSSCLLGTLFFAACANEAQRIDPEPTLNPGSCPRRRARGPGDPRLGSRLTRISGEPPLGLVRRHD